MGGTRGSILRLYPELRTSQAAIGSLSRLKPNVDIPEFLSVMVILLTLFLVVVVGVDIVEAGLFVTVGLLAREAPRCTSG